VPGVAFVIADVAEPAHPLDWKLAADAWDEAVREQALELEGSTKGFAFFERERRNTYRYFDPEDVHKP
jgi:hypothetical protein